MRIMLFLIPSLLFCGDNTNTDIIPRTINFIIFFALFLYFALPHLRNLYKNRIKSIASRLEKAQNNVLSVKAQKEDAVARLNKAKEQAEIIIAQARAQEEIMIKNMEEQLQKEILHMQTNYKNLENSLEKQAKAEIINKIIEKLFNDDDSKLSQDDLLKIVARKVA